MNEPHDLAPETKWFDMAQASINAIREVDTNTLIMVGGNDWSSAERWIEQSDTLKFLKDPANNLAFEAHVYLTRMHPVRTNIHTKRKNVIRRKESTG